MHAAQGMAVFGGHAVGLELVAVTVDDVGHAIQGFAAAVVGVGVVVRVDAIGPGHFGAEADGSESVDGGVTATQAELGWKMLSALVVSRLATVDDSEIVQMIAEHAALSGPEDGDGDPGR